MSPSTFFCPVSRFTLGLSPCTPPPLDFSPKACSFRLAQTPHLYITSGSRLVSCGPRFMGRRQLLFGVMLRDFLSPPFFFLFFPKEASSAPDFADSTPLASQGPTAGTAPTCSSLLAPPVECFSQAFLLVSARKPPGLLAPCDLLNLSNSPLVFSVLNPSASSGQLLLASPLERLYGSFSEQPLLIIFFVRFPGRTRPCSFPGYYGFPFSDHVLRPPPNCSSRRAT